MHTGEKDSAEEAVIKQTGRGGLLVAAGRNARGPELSRRARACPLLNKLRHDADRDFHHSG
jgi:hypothetical protein